MRALSVAAHPAREPFSQADEGAPQAAEREPEPGSRAHHAGPALLHRVHPGRGLVDADFAVLAAWAEGLRGGSRA
ncbi:hypothetical protein [Kitasatospora sp. NPDC088548]|uniref:hypothetical protein n=1 Tax=Kitasatospora sp. NPDC088548 TaxID=3364075 RepID=UPI00382758A4